MKKLICSGNSGRTDELSAAFLLVEQIRNIRGLIVGTDKNSAPFSVEQISVCV